MFDSKKIREDFPILSQRHPNGKRLAYLDSSATSQKPQVVIDAMSSYYRNENANVHRGVHYLSDRSTSAWEESRKKIAQYFDALPEELVVVNNATEAINIFALSWGEQTIQEGDVIITTLLEHHSNLVPWQRLTQKKKATLLIVPVQDDGLLDLSVFDAYLEKYVGKIALIAISQVSNTLGTVNPLDQIISKIDVLKKKQPKKYPVLFVDGAQEPTHRADGWLSGIDAYAVSAHKMLGPLGIGGLFVRKKLLASIDPIFVGGGMIDEVTLQHATYASDLSLRFSAGTPNVAGLVGWASACTYVRELGNAVFDHDTEIVAYALERLGAVKELSLVGPLDPKLRAGSVAFTYNGVHAHDVAQILDSEGVAVRSGHHCTMPLHTHFGWSATTRASFSVYTTKEDIDQLVDALQAVHHIFHRSYTYG